MKAWQFKFISLQNYKSHNLLPKQEFNFFRESKFRRRLPASKKHFRSFAAGSLAATRIDGLPPTLSYTCSTWQASQNQRHQIY